MANIFDQFDSGGGASSAAQAAPPPAPSDGPPDDVRAPIAAYSMKGGNIFDQFDQSGGSGEDRPSFSGTAMNFVKGINERLPQYLGAPVDAVTAALNRLRSFSNDRMASDPLAQRFGMDQTPLAPITNPFGGSQSIQQGLNALGVRPQDTPTTNAEERAAQAAGGATVDTIGSVLGARYAAPFVPASAPVTRGVLQTMGNAPLGQTAIAGAAGGATGERAAEAVPDQYAYLRPLADTLGNLAGGGVAAAGLHYGGAAVRGFGNVAGNTVAPFYEAGRQRLAAQRVAQAATDPSAARAALANGDEIGIPGSSPTTGQLTADEGLLSLQSNQARGAPELFAERANQQDAARAAYAGTIPPAGVQAGDLSAHIMDTFTRQDEATQAALDAAVSRGAAKVRAVGGDVTPQEAGDTIRQEIDAARTSAKRGENAAWSAIEASGLKALPIQPTKDAVKSVLDTIPEDATQPSGDEAAIYQKILAWPKVRDFRNFQAVRSDLLAAMAQERATNGISPAYRRMSDVERGMFNNIGSQAMAAEAAPPRPSNSAFAVNAPSVGDSVYTPSGNKLGVRYEIAEGDTLIPSHSQDLTPNPDFPPSLQPRDRTRVASSTQIASMAQQLQPERLGASPDAMSGAPIVGPDNIVESGNARTLAILRAYREGGPSATAYRDFLNQRFNTEGYDKPILVRRRTTDLSPAQRINFVQEANANPGLSMSATERAAQDAGRLGPAVLDLYKGGDIASAENRPFVLAFMKSVPQRGEEGSFVTSGNALSLEGQRRVENALVAKAYPNSHVVAQLAETGDEAGRNFANSMKAAGGTMAQLRGAVAAGDVPAHFDITPAITQAAELVHTARVRGVPLRDLVAQQDAFANVHPQRDDVLRAAFGQNLSGRMNQAKLADVLRFYGEEANKQSTQAQLFASDVTPQAILAQGASRYGKTTAAPAGAPRSAPGVGEGPGTGGQEAHGPGNASEGLGATGQAAAGAGAGQPPRSGILQGPPLNPNWTSEDAAAYRLALARSRDRIQTFDRGAVGRTLDQQGYGVYKLADSQVPARFFNSGARSFQDAQDFLRAAGDRPKAVAALQDYAASSLLKAAKRGDGTLDPAKYAAWTKRYTEPLRAFPELAAKFSDAASAEDAISEAVKGRADYQAAVSKSIASRFLGGADPSRAIEGALGTRNAVAAMRELATRTASSPEARGGLQRAAIELLSRRSGDFSNAAGLGQYMAKNRAALSEIFSPEQMNTLDRVIADAQRARISVPGSRNTAAKYSIVERFMIYGGLGTVAEVAGEAVGHHGLGFAVAAYPAIAHLRTKLLAHVDDIVTGMMLNPELARTALLKVSDAEAPKLIDKLATQYAALTMSAAAQPTRSVQASPPSMMPAPNLPMPPVYWGPNNGIFQPAGAR